PRRGPHDLVHHQASPGGVPALQSPQQLAHERSWDRAAQPAEIPPFAGPLELDEQGDHVAPHVGSDLAAQPLEIAAMEVADNRGGLIAADAAGVEDPVPKFGVSRASGGADVQAFIKTAQTLEDLAPEGHVGPRADVPDRAASSARGRVEVRPEI